MEKYGTPQIVTKTENGMCKVSAKKLTNCCIELLKEAKESKEVVCSCGNHIAIEKSDE